MNTARIVVQTVAIGAGGIAEYLASGSDRFAPPVAATAARLPTLALELIPRQTAPFTGAHQSGMQPLRSSAGVSIFRYGIPSQTARI